MLTSSQSGAYICLRCQSRAARQFFDVTRNASRHQRYFLHSTRTFAKSAKKIYPHGKLRGKKGGEVRESSEVLPLNALGKPTEIIVLRDADIDRSKEEDNDVAKEPQRPKKSSKKAILESVEKGTVAVDETSTIKSIDELRDTILGRQLEQGDNILQEEHDKLAKALEDGFTTKQLRQYATQKGKNLLMRNSKTTGKLPHSDWTPGITPTDERHLIISKLLGRINVAKSKLARMIVERGWQLHLDSTTGVGEVDVYDAQSFMQARDEYGQYGTTRTSTSF
jgi:hypothetical protein